MFRGLKEGKSAWRLLLKFRHKSISHIHGGAAGRSGAVAACECEVRLVHSHLCLPGAAPAPSPTSWVRSQGSSQSDPVEPKADYAPALPSS